MLGDASVDQILDPGSCVGTTLNLQTAPLSHTQPEMSPNNSSLCSASAAESPVVCMLQFWGTEHWHVI